MIYLDHHATAPASEGVIAAMTDAMRAHAGNASSTHAYGRDAAALFAEAKQCIARALQGDGGAVYAIDPNDVLLVGSATEANNLAVKGAVEGWWERRRTKPSVAVSAIEHSSILACARRLAARGMCDLVVIPVGRDGRVDVRDVANALRPNTCLVSVMTANNEVGAMQPVEAIHALCRQANVPYHADATQDFAKVSRKAPPGDLVVGSGHKLGAPVGVAFLYGTPWALDRLEPQLVGGSTQRALRGGTFPVALAAAFAAACREARAAYCEGKGERVGGLTGEALRQARMRDTFLRAVMESLAPLGSDAVTVNGPLDPPAFAGVPQRTDDPAQRARLFANASLTFEGVCPTALHQALAPYAAVSSAAACKSLGGDRSHVLEAMYGEDGPDLYGATLRVGFGKCNTLAHAAMLARLVVDAVTRLRGVGCAIPHADTASTHAHEGECEGGVCPTRGSRAGKR